MLEKLKVISAIEIVQNYTNAVLKKVPDLLLALVIVVLFYVLSKIIQKLAGKIIDQATHDRSLQSLFRTLIRVFVMVAGILIAAAVVFPGLQAGDLIGVLGLSSVAIGFAFKDIFQNFLAGVLILTQRPFKLGDQIARGNIEGTVEQINIRSTIIKTYDGQRIVVPNAELFTNAVTVRTAYEKRRTTFKTGIAYSEDINKAREVIRGAVAASEFVESDPEPQIFVSGHDDSAVSFDIRYWTDTKRSVVVQSIDDVGTRVKNALDEAGIEIPFPYRTVEFFDKTDYAQLLEGLSPEQLELIAQLKGATRAPAPPSE